MCSAAPIILARVQAMPTTGEGEGTLRTWDAASGLDGRGWLL